MSEHYELGKAGEQCAVEWLVAKGYTIRERNWRFQKAEVDIIAQKGDLLCVVEVKTRTTSAFGSPQDFVNQKKIKLLVLAIDQYVQEHGLDVEVRFDIIAITKNKGQFVIEHLEDAFLHF